MTVMNVNPTRMELTRLKKRLAVARRGHKMLKDKRDELMKQFLELAITNRKLREEVENNLKKVYEKFMIARAIMSTESFEESLMFPKLKAELNITVVNRMGVEIPVYDFVTAETHDSDIYPYGFAETSAELDGALAALDKVLPDLLKLAGVEKAIQLLALEIESVRRRVNALEHVLIPQLTDTIRYISMKLEENERSNLVRLMKVKDMILEQAHGYKK